MAQEFFADVTGPIPFGGLGSDDPLAFKVYQPDRIVLGKRMEDQLRIAVCLWHSFNSPGSDVFGVGTFDRPWLDARVDPMLAAQAKLDAAFEFLQKLGMPFFCFPRSGHRTRGHHLRPDAGQPGGDGRPGRGAHGPHGGAPLVGHCQPLRPSPICRRCRHKS